MCTVGLLAAVAGLAYVGGRVSTTVDGNAALAGQPEGEMPPGATLAPEHDQLKRMLGNWEGTVRMKAGPDAWTESTGTIHRELAMDGRFVIEHVTGDMGGEKFKGMGIVGYNTIEKKYESVWIENMQTNISFATGSYDKSKGTWTFEGEMLDPMTGQRSTVVSILDTSDPDTEVMSAYMVMPDGSREKGFEGTFKRVK